MIRRIAIFSVLISVSLAASSSYRYRRAHHEGNENLVKYYHRPKYVYNLHDEDSEEQSGPQVEYKYVFKKDHESKWDDSSEHHRFHDEEDNEPVKDTENHIEIEHDEHATSHQSFEMHHFKPTKVFIKKHDLSPKKPIEIGVTKHKFEFVHKKQEPPPKKIETPVYNKLELESFFNPKDYQHDYHYEYKDKTPKAEYHVVKEMRPNTLHHYEKFKKHPFANHKQKPKIEYKFEHPRKFQTEDFSSYEYIREPPKKLKIEDYQHNGNDHAYYYQQQQQQQKQPHYTVYRGNTASDEEMATSMENEGESDEDVPHDIHVYHKF